MNAKQKYAQKLYATSYYSRRPKTHKYFHKDFISQMYRDKLIHTAQEKIEIMRLRDKYLKAYRKKHHLNQEIKLIMKPIPCIQT